jgi:hypothetical protein
MQLVPLHHVFKSVDPFFKRPVAPAKQNFTPVAPTGNGSSASDFSSYEVPVKKSALGAFFGGASKKPGLASLAKNASSTRTKVGLYKLRIQFDPYLESAWFQA